jgi:hypothetical protein
MDATGKTKSVSVRQRSRADQPALLKLVRGTADSTDPHSTRTADAEWSRGEFQRSIAGRMLLGGHLKTGQRWTLQNRPMEQNQNKSIYTVQEAILANIFGVSARRCLL